MTNWPGLDEDFESFVRANTTPLLRTAYLLTGSAHSGEELLQDTLAHLYPRWDRVAGADVPLAYVRRTLANRFVSSRRTRASRDLPFAEVPDSPDSGDSADIAETVSTQRATWELLRDLPARQRAAIVLRFYDDLPDDQIGEVLGCRPGTVRSLISRGLVALRTPEARLVRMNTRAELAS